MFWRVIGIYPASSVTTGLFSAVKSLATVRRSSLTLEGFSTVPPDFTEVLIVVSSALSSETFFFRSSGSICFISRLRSIANRLLLLSFYLWGFHDRRLHRSGRRDTGRWSLHCGLVYAMLVRLGTRRLSGLVQVSRWLLRITEDSRCQISFREVLLDP